VGKESISVEIVALEKLDGKTDTRGQQPLFNLRFSPHLMGVRPAPALLAISYYTQRTMCIMCLFRDEPHAPSTF